MFVVSIFVLRGAYSSIGEVKYSQGNSTQLVSGGLDWPNGLSEFEQYLHCCPPGKKRPNRARDFTNFVYATSAQLVSYNVDVVLLPDSSVRVTLVEYVRGNRSAGGSNFLVEWHSGVYCPVVDRADGEYESMCPPSGDQMCHRLVVDRQGIDYSSMEFRMDPSRHIIFNRTICAVKLASAAVLRKHAANRVITWSIPAKDPGINDPYTNHVFITQQYGRPVTLMSVEEICNALEHRYSHVSLIGASHIRYNFDYILTSCYKSVTLTNLSRKHGSYTVGNVSYQQIWQSNEYQKGMDRELTAYPGDANSLMIAQCGSHDMVKHDIADTMSYRIELYLKEVLRMLASGARVLVVTPPPYPDTGQAQNRLSQVRNNHVSLAFNYRLIQRLKQMQTLYKKLEYFDEFNALLPWQRVDTICTGHYMCRKPGQGVSGHIAIQILRLMLTNVLS